LNNLSTAERACVPAPSRERGGIFYKLLVFSAIAGVLLVLYLVRAPVLRGFAEWWIVDEEPQVSHAIVVLGGDSVFGDRVRHAVELYRRGWATRIVLSGMTLRANFNETVLMEREAITLGVPKESLILHAHNARSTIEEGLALRQLFLEEQIRRVIFVTSNFHTRRTRMAFRKIFHESGVEMRVSAASDIRFEPRRWWEQRTSRNTFLLELLKVPNTWMELDDMPPASPPALPDENEAE